MRLRTPSFWYKKSACGALAGIALLPLSLLYWAGHVLNQARIKPHRPETKIICIGNLTAGGSGKTPVAIAIMNLVFSRRIAQKPCFLSRGYGGTLKGPIFVDPQKQLYRDVGDEAFLLVRHAPVIVSANRRAGADMAHNHGRDLIVMDDGLQNPSLEKTLSLAVIDGRTGFGNSLLLPAGPLRETLAAGFKKTDAFILIGDDVNEVQKKLPKGKPVIRARLNIPKTWIADTKTPYLAFSGIGQPEKFRDTVTAKGLVLAGWHAFPDHYHFTLEDLHRLDREACEKNARLLTTEKDAARLPDGFLFRAPLDIMPVCIEWDDENALYNLLAGKILR